MDYAPHFTEAELTFSQTATRNGIDNAIPDDLRPNLIRLSWWLEYLREIVQKPIIITSGYRCPYLNNAIGGSKTSAHMDGLAADIYVPDLTPCELARLAAEKMYDQGYDQIIHEFGRWVHVGLGIKIMRFETLTAMRENGRTVYKRGILEV